MRLIDADALIEKCGNWYVEEGTESGFIGTLKNLLAIQPTVQQEIIRCKDCKHRHVENMVWTCPFGLSGGENFFCGYGTEPYKGE